MNITVRYGSTKHTKIRDALDARKKMWHRASADRRQKWATDQKRYNAYVSESDDDVKRKGKKRETSVNEYTQIHIPYSYGLIMAFHTYQASVFLARSPILQFQERHGQGPGNTQAVEAIMDYQVHVGKQLVPYYLWLMDATKHGLGVVGTYWRNEIVRVAKIVEEAPMFGPFQTGKKKKIKRVIEVPGYQGNRVYNIRPHDFVFDTRVSLADFQTGEFAGRLFDISWLDLEEGEADGTYFNIDVLRKKHPDDSARQDVDRDSDELVIDLPDRATPSEFSNQSEHLRIPRTGRLEGYEMVVRLIPKNWGLGSGDRVEKWVFTVVGDILIEARPFGELHDQFPYSALETEIDGYALYKRSMLEIADPLNNVLSWLINTHFFNIRKSLNNMFVADPMRVMMGDFKNPEYGLAIRLKPEAYGTPISNVIQQFQTQDVTQQHMNDTKIIAELLQQTLGINTQLMGMLEGGGRRTATEVRGSTGFSMNRLKTQAEYMSALGFTPMSQMMLQSTQQHLSVQRYYKIVGDLEPGNAQNMLQVGPEDILGFYDYVPVDGTMPVDKLALANLWKEIMAGVAQSPELMMKYDIGQIFAYAAQLAGAKNINRFKIQMMPDDQLAAQEQAGNLVPITGGQGGGQSVPSRSRAAESGRLADTAARVNEPTQLTGVGPVS